MKTIRAAWIIGFVVLLNGCNGRGTDEPGQFNPLDQIEGRVEFARLSQAVLSTRCLSCHQEFSSEASLLASPEYVVPGVPEQSKLYIRTQNGSMPLGGSRLSDSQISLIAEYIRGLSAPGPLPTPTAAPTPTPVVVTYGVVQAQLIAPTCLRCHGAGSGTGIELHSFESVRLNSNMIALAIESGIMPPSRPVSDELKTLFREWMDGGFQP